MPVLRETQNFRAERSATGVRITAKAPGVCPRSRVVSKATWIQLVGMSDSAFDGSIVLDLGVGSRRC